MLTEKIGLEAASF